MGSMLGKRGCVSQEQREWFKEVEGSYVKGSSVYWENMVTRILLHISALVMSVAVMSMKTFRVLRLILV